MKDHSPQAFPCPTGVFQVGMSLRDYFAAAALTGLLSSPNIVPKDGVKRPLHVELTYTAYECADAMLAEREKP